MLSAVEVQNGTIQERRLSDRVRVTEKTSGTKHNTQINKGFVEDQGESRTAYVHHGSLLLGCDLILPLGLIH